VGLQKKLSQPGHGRQTEFVGQLFCRVQGLGLHVIGL